MAGGSQQLHLHVWRADPGARLSSMAMRADRLLIFELGSPRGYLPDRLGDFVDWILDAIGPQPLPLVVIDALAPELPELAAGDAVITTCSVGSVYDREPWSERAAAWLLRAVERDLPVLGICFGHQLLAQALGGRVAPNPAGPEVGTFEVRRLVEDLLFDGMGERFAVHHTHFDAVLEPPPGAVVLASTGPTAVQSLALGERARTVQWHPEFFAEVTAGFVPMFREPLGEAATAEALASVHEPPDRGRLLRNFLRHFAGVPI